MTTGRISIIWSNGEDVFCLGRIGERLDLENKCGAGFGEILQRLTSGRWWVNDIRETIRLGLIGGGMEPVRAQRVVNRHVDEQPLGPNVLVAITIMSAAMIEPPGEQPGKGQADGTTGTESTSLTTGDGLSGPPYIDSGDASAGIHVK